MRVSMTAATAAAVAITVMGVPPPAHASEDDWGLNGTYTATSNGEWARTNERFHDEASIRSTWTITTVCSYPTECTGTVTSDFGWSAPIYKTGGVWYVKRTVENWEPCPDGTQTDPTSPILVGEDQTTGPSGACGISKSLFVNMPFKLVKTEA